MFYIWSRRYNVYFAMPYSQDPNVDTVHAETMAKAKAFAERGEAIRAMMEDNALRTAAGEGALDMDWMVGDEEDIQDEIALADKRARSLEALYASGRSVFPVGSEVMFFGTVHLRNGHMVPFAHIREGEAAELQDFACASDPNPVITVVPYSIDETFVPHMWIESRNTISVRADDIAAVVMYGSSLEDE
jgi:hypothetical protein